MLLQEQDHFRTAPDVAAPRRAPVISFVMPMYDGLELTRACLRTLEQTVDLSPHEVILVNDASTDGTCEFLDTLRAPYRVLHNDVRLSYAATVNRGVAAARGELLCLLNNDLVFTSNWLTPMVRAFDLFPNVGFVGNVQIDPRTGRYDHMGMAFADDGMPTHFGRDFRFLPFRGHTRWRAVTAACCLVRRTVFLHAGGFDEQYINGGEDVDLCLRLSEAGYQHYVANQSVIYHHVGSSEGRHSFTSQNNARLLQRWKSHVQESRTNRDRRLLALNYLLRHIAQPWRYNGPRFWNSLVLFTMPGMRD